MPIPTAQVRQASNPNPDVQGIPEMLRSLTPGPEVSEVKPKPDHSHDLSLDVSEARNREYQINSIDNNQYR